MLGILMPRVLHTLQIIRVGNSLSTKFYQGAVMLKESSVSESSLKILYVIKSSLDRVYSAWTEKDKLKPWMGGSDVTVNNVALDFRVDGKFELEMESPNGLSIAFGKYRVIEAEKIIFSWGWKETMVNESLITVKLEQTPQGVIINLTQQGLPSEQAVNHHMEGWISSLEKLVKYLD